MRDTASPALACGAPSSSSDGAVGFSGVDTLRLSSSGWWLGWTSATIARIGYPPPKQLTPPGEKLRNISIVLVALGVAVTVRTLVTGKLPLQSRAGA